MPSTAAGERCRCSTSRTDQRASRRQGGADQITPYPPGIPVLVPGQTITAEVTQYLVGLLRSQKRVELHGIVYDGYLPCLRVLTAAEEKGLKKLVK